jgi:hypothetical protein
MNVRLLATLVLTLGFGFACQAEKVVKQGAALEACNGAANDCREGNICLAGVCRPNEIVGYDCEAMCQRISQCGGESNNCVADCQATIAGASSSNSPCPWSDAAVEAFGQCIVEDLTCDEIINGDAPQLCYQSLDLPTERAERCDAILEGLELCESSQALQDGTFQQCYRLARTATDPSFERIEPCEQIVSVGDECVSLEECATAVFQF